jgi:hypothetical protein
MIESRETSAALNSLASQPPFMPGRRSSTSGESPWPTTSAQADPGLRRVATAHPRFFCHLELENSHLPPGWVRLVDELCVDLGRLLGDADVNFRIVRVSERFGSLRLQWQLLPTAAPLFAAPDERSDARGFRHRPDRTLRLRAKITRRVGHAERASLHVCEQCGKPGTLHPSGWWRVECPDHS